MNYEDLDTEFVNIENTRRLQAEIPASRLVNALLAYEQVIGEKTLPRLVIYSDGSGRIETRNAGENFDFNTPAQAVEWLEQKAGLRT